MSRPPLDPEQRQRIEALAEKLLQADDWTRKRQTGRYLRLVLDALTDAEAEIASLRSAQQQLIEKWRTKAQWLRSHESPDAVLAMGDLAANATYGECADELEEATSRPGEPV